MNTDEYCFNVSKNWEDLWIIPMVIKIGILCMGGYLPKSMMDDY